MSTLIGLSERSLARAIEPPGESSPACLGRTVALELALLASGVKWRREGLLWGMSAGCRHAGRRRLSLDVMSLG